MLRLIVDDADRGELVKALRLAEASHENRRPLVLYEAPFAETDSYFNGLCNRIAEDYESLRKGAAEEGVVLAPFGRSENVGAEHIDPIGRAVLHAERFAALLGERLDGVLVVLIPAWVEGAARWRECIETFAEAPFSQRVRVAVVDRPGGALEPVLGVGGARLAIDRTALSAYAKQLTSREHRDPAGASQPVCTKARELAHVLLDAADRTRQGDMMGAAERYGRAITLCQAAELTTEEASVRMAHAGACLAAGNAPAALESYSKAAELGERENAFPIVCQARLGAAGVAFAFKRYGHAAMAYEAAAEAARRAELPLLRIEALRMAGTCHVLEGAEENALITWIEAINTGIATTLPIRTASTLAQAAESLRGLLAEVGLVQHAADVASSMQALLGERRESVCS